MLSRLRVWLSVSRGRCPELLFPRRPTGRSPARALHSFHVLSPPPPPLVSQLLRNPVGFLSGRLVGPVEEKKNTKMEGWGGDPEVRGPPGTHGWLPPCHFWPQTQFCDVIDQLDVRYFNKS